MVTEIYQCSDCNKIFIVKDAKKPKCNHNMTNKDLSDKAVIIAGVI